MDTAAHALTGQACPGTFAVVTQDMQVPAGQDIQAEIRLRVDRFEKATTRLGCKTDVARAGLVGMSDRQLRRARAQRPVGDQAVAKILVGLRRAGLNATFEQFFEIHEAAA